MERDAAEFIGSAAGILTTISFIPQVVKTWRSGSARDLSFGMYLVLFVGVVLWMVYGMILVAWPIIIANLFTAMLSGFILIMKIAYILRERRSGRMG
jgi:MtN3 and saliva related transmembrane protein